MKKTKVTMGLLIGVVVAMCAPNVFADVLIDDFNNSDYSNWTLTRMQNVNENTSRFYGECTDSPTNPYMRDGSVNFAADSSNRYAIVRIAHDSASEGTAMDIFWRRTIDSDWNGTRKVGVTPIKDGAYHTYVIDMETCVNHANWNGTIDMIRLDPIVYNTTQGRWFEVDNFEFSSVPEPATMVLLGLGSIALLVRRKRRA